MRILHKPLKKCKFHLSFSPMERFLRHLVFHLHLIISQARLLYINSSSFTAVVVAVAADAAIATVSFIFWKKLCKFSLVTLPLHSVTQPVIQSSQSIPSGIFIISKNWCQNRICCYKILTLPLASHHRQMNRQRSACAFWLKSCN